MSLDLTPFVTLFTLLFLPYSQGGGGVEAPSNIPRNSCRVSGEGRTGVSGGLLTPGGGERGWMAFVFAISRSNRAAWEEEEGDLAPLIPFQLFQLFGLGEYHRRF